MTFYHNLTELSRFRYLETKNALIYLCLTVFCKFLGMLGEESFFAKDW